jgi:6-phosphogluconolactonase (cycloisomerase 2 family)
MKLSLFGRWSMALFASMVLGLGMTACGGGTIGYMWVLGQEYNQIGGFKIDDYSGNLTEVPGAPFSSNGSMPVSLVVTNGGRYVYVINQGVGGTSSQRGTGQTIALFSVGGDGVLTFQQSYQSQGYISQWAQLDSSSSYLFVLDKYSPSYIAPNTPGYPAVGGYIGPNTDGNGSITSFAIDATTGRLTLVTNAQIKNNELNIPFFEVGQAPFMMKSLAGCLYTTNSANQSITPYAVGTGGQLNTVITGTFYPQTENTTSINGTGGYIFLTDSGSNRLFGFQSGGNCNLTALNGGTTPNTVGTSNPVYSLLDSKSEYLYILNGSSTSTNPSGPPYSSISAFTVNATNQELSEIVPGQTYTVGAGPVCMVEDPSSQYMYVSNHNDGTITGKAFAATTGELSQLKRGSTFPTVGQPGCLAVSGSID